MKDLIVRSDDDILFTPSVAFSATSGKCLIEGESYLEDAFDFYQKLLEWIEQYITTQGRPLAITFDLSYFNTSSSRGILNLLVELAKQQKAGANISVEWFYPVPDEDDMLAEIEDFMIESGVKMKILPKNKKKK